MSIKSFLILFIGCIFSQSFSQDYQDQSVLLSRYKIGVGIVKNLSDENDFKIDRPFMNVSYRTSGFDKYSSSTRLKGAFEAGVSGLFLTDEKEELYALYPLPYAKVGPELRLYRNTFLAANAGLAFIYFLGSWSVIPFAGLNGFYLIRLSNKICIELETGFHIPAASLDHIIYLTYFTVGISFD
jgi:hypothetical protein